MAFILSPYLTASYEDLGLIKSIREADYAYRLYDYSELKRLEQILALRKLSISIKDIQTIFKCNDINILLVGPLYHVPYHNLGEGKRTPGLSSA